MVEPPSAFTQPGDKRHPAPPGGSPSLARIADPPGKARPDLLDKIFRFSSQKSIKTNTTVYETHKPLLTGKSGLVATMQDAEFPGDRQPYVRWPISGL